MHPVFFFYRAPDSDIRSAKPFITHLVHHHGVKEQEGYHLIADNEAILSSRWERNWRRGTQNVYSLDAVRVQCFGLHQGMLWPWGNVTSK